MFDAIAKGFRQAKNRLAGLSELSEGNIENALREVRLSLLEADVELGVVKSFLARVKEKALGEVVRVKAKDAAGHTVQVSAGDQFTKICHDELVAFMSGEGDPLTFAESGPTGIMMVGLQGSGKTTTTSKLAAYLRREEKKRVLLCAADMQRPAAVEQLQVLGKSLDIPVFNIAGESPVKICAEAFELAKREKYDVVIFDTAGRLAIDEALMSELADVKTAVKPQNILLVVDAMIGQDAVKVSRGFNDRLGLTGVVLTKLDGDARGGAALSVKEVTGAPVRFVGTGESADKFEIFRPEGMASRVLGMGDVVGLMKDFEGVINEQNAEEEAMKLLGGNFTLDDFLQQIRMIQKMGSLSDLLGKMPGMDQMMPPGAKIDDNELVKVEAMICSFTLQERKDPFLLMREPGRVSRIAKGSAHTDKEIEELVQRFVFMKQMMEGFGQQSGLLNAIPGMKQLGMMKNMKKMMGQQGMPGMGGFGGLPGMPGMNFPGMNMPGFGLPFGGMGGGPSPTEGMTKMKTLSSQEKNAKKAQRKREKDARKKGRR